ncbi:hypothetical protein [Chrysiogenes arsenatis]|uniref:hypothetical protein n=1 Tax=Chrysiogenes arsenatis TaxID=309797 RepID=UPI0004286DFE|nr:hypothetical protein [Chrysiogenes arsenatis]
MKRFLGITVIALTSATAAWSFDISEYETGNAARGQWAWFTGQSRDCADPIPVPGKFSRAEWKEMFTTAKDKLPCGGAGLKENTIKHVFKFLYEHASDSETPMKEKPASCG